MAEGWARRLHGDALDVSSAGIEAHGLTPLAVTVMAEAGVDISTQLSQTLGDLPNPHFDVVITVCDNAAQNCPVFPGNARVLHQPFDDPPQLAAHATTTRRHSHTTDGCATRSAPMSRPCTQACRLDHRRRRTRACWVPETPPERASA